MTRHCERNEAIVSSDFQSGIDLDLLRYARNDGLCRNSNTIKNQVKLFLSNLSYKNSLKPATLKPYATIFIRNILADTRMLSQTEVLQELNQDIWSPTAMNAVIAAKAEKRAGKGQDLHTYTLDLSPPKPLESDEYNKERLAKFVELIHQQAQASDTPIRIQLALHTSIVHWSAVDLEISKSGVKMIQIDAAADSSASIGFLQITKTKIQTL